MFTTACEQSAGGTTTNRHIFSNLHFCVCIDCEKSIGSDDDIMSKGVGSIKRMQKSFICSSAGSCSFLQPDVMVIVLHADDDDHQHYVWSTDDSDTNTRGGPGTTPHTGRKTTESFKTLRWILSKDWKSVRISSGRLKTKLPMWIFTGWRSPVGSKTIAKFQTMSWLARSVAADFRSHVTLWTYQGCQTPFYKIS